MKIYLTYRERVAGLFLLTTLILIALFVVGAAVENLWFTPRKDYYLYVARGDGLRKGSQVLLSGVEIGRVGKMEILQDGRIHVTLAVLSVHSYRITGGTRAEIRRVLGIGEKRILLYQPPEEKSGAVPLPEGSAIPVDEPRDLIDVVSTMDLGKYMETLDRAVASMDLVMTKLEEDDRLVRMMEAFDKLGPTFDIMNSFFTQIEEPFVAVISDPNLRESFKGLAAMTNDPKMRTFIHHMADSLEPARVKALIRSSDQLISRFDALLESDGPLLKTLDGTDRLLNDGRVDRMITSLDALTQDEQFNALIRNLGMLADQMALLGPDLPGMSKELNETMRELSIVLKALQRTWFLDDETQAVRKEMSSKPDAGSNSNSAE